MQRLKVIKGHLACNKVSAEKQDFQLTLDGFYALTTEQRTFYEKNGYLVVKRLISQDDMNKYIQRFKEICCKKVAVPNMIVMRDIAKVKANAKCDETSVNRIQNFYDDPILFEYCRRPELLQYAETFVGEDIMVMHTMLINKPSDQGTKTSRHPLHQDLHYFPFRPVDRIVAAWTALEHVDRSNGCLVVVPGSHKGVLLRHKYPDWQDGVNQAFHGAEGYDATSPRVHLTMEAGDTVFFHPLLVHGSGANKTSGFRKAISCHFASSACHYIDVAGTVHQNIADESTRTIQKKYNVNLDYVDLWRLQGRLVQGHKRTL